MSPGVSIRGRENSWHILWFFTFLHYQDVVKSQRIMQGKGHCLTHNRLQWPWEADYCSLLNRFLLTDRIALCLNNRKGWYKLLKMRNFMKNAAVPWKDKKLKANKIPFVFQPWSTGAMWGPNGPLSNGVGSRLGVFEVSTLVNAACQSTKSCIVTTGIESDPAAVTWTKGKSSLVGTRLGFTK